MGLYQGFCKLSGPFISGSCPETPLPSFCHCIHAKSPLWCRFLVSLEWVLVWTVLLSFCFPGSSTSSPFFWPFRPFFVEIFGLFPLNFRRSSYCVLRQFSANFQPFLIWLCLILYEEPMILFLKLHQFLLKLLHILWYDFSTRRHVTDLGRTHWIPWLRSECEAGRSRYFLFMGRIFIRSFLCRIGFFFARYVLW